MLLGKQWVIVFNNGDNPLLFSLFSSSSPSKYFTQTKFNFRNVLYVFFWELLKCIESLLLHMCCSKVLYDLWNSKFYSEAETFSIYLPWIPVEFQVNTQKYIIKLHKISSKWLLCAMQSLLLAKWLAMKHLSFHMWRS